MRRLPFFALLVSCASHDVATVEIAQPLPTITATASVEPADRVVIKESLSFDDQRDPRRDRSLRQKALVVTEVSQLVQLLAATAANALDRPMLLMRIAEDYVELRKLHVDGAERKAIDSYKALVDQYPSFVRVDEALYELGLEYEVAGDMAQARRTQYELIQKFPQSRFLAYAYFAFGEMFMAEAASDPTKLELATQSYREALKLSSPLTNACVCRLARIFTLKHEDAAAASLMQKYGQTCGA